MPQRCRTSRIRSRNEARRLVRHDKARHAMAEDWSDVARGETEAVCNSLGRNRSTVSRWMTPTDGSSPSPADIIAWDAAVGPRLLDYIIDAARGDEVEAPSGGDLLLSAAEAQSVMGDLLSEIARATSSDSPGGRDVVRMEREAIAALWGRIETIARGQRKALEG